MLELAKRSIVIMQPNTAADFDTDMRRANVLSEWVLRGDLLLTKTDCVHSRPQIHSPNRFRTEFADVEP